MNRFYDYMIVRIYRWYETFDNQPSLFTAKLLVTLHQTFIVLIAVNFIELYLPITTLTLKVLTLLLSAIFFFRLHKRYSDDFLKSLIKKYSKEERTMRRVKGLAIPLILFLPIVVAVITAKIGQA